MTTFIGDIVGRDKMVILGESSEEELIDDLIVKKLAEKLQEDDDSGRDCGVVIIAGGGVTIRGGVFARDVVKKNEARETGEGEKHSGD